ncbi:MAG: septum site-determining protein MinC [Bdellovibrionales bacterium]|nr:septum site-determining protein MinC [Bdellovibrionales bacterium]
MECEGSGINESKLVYARGIAEGLVIRLDATAEPLTLQAALRDFMISRSGFLKGASVFLDWTGGMAPEALAGEVQAILKKEFLVEAERLPERLRAKIEVLSSDSLESSRLDSVDESKTGKRKSSEKKRGGAYGMSSRHEDEALSLFDGFDSEEFEEGAFGGSDFEGDSHFDDEVAESKEGVAAKSAARIPGAGATARGVQEYDLLGELDEDVLGDVADARMVFGTLRSGQRIESEHSIIVAGDLNSGAELVAGGDIFVLGKLRGVAHAGAYDETGAGRVIFALELEPTQLRIGSVITRGSGGEVSGSSDSRSVTPEIARVDGNMIVVEPYQKRRGSMVSGRSKGVSRRGVRV